MKENLSKRGCWENIIVVNDCQEMKELMICLRMIQNGEFFSSQENNKNISEDHDWLAMVIIDGLSILHWENLESQAWQQLGGALLEIKDFYHASILTTSFHRSYYDSTKHSSSSTRTPTNSANMQNDLKFIAGQVSLGYLGMFEHVFYVRRSLRDNVTGKYFRKGNDKAISINNGKVSL